MRQTNWGASMSARIVLWTHYFFLTSALQNFINGFCNLILNILYHCYFASLSVFIVKTATWIVILTHTTLIQ